METPRIRLIFYKIFIPLCAVAAGLLLAETGAGVLGYIRFSTFAVPQLYERDRNNTFLEYLEESGNAYVSSLFPHPYLGFVHRKGYAKGINNIGLLGPDYPDRKDPEKFVILVTGGSVAAQTVMSGRDGLAYLQDLLNTRYQFQGREVVILNGGDGAWAQPQQAILFMLYADVLDAVVTLDGFNEHYLFRGKGKRLGLPGNNFMEINPIARGYNVLVASWFSNGIRKVCRSDRILKHSRLAWLFSYAVTSALQRYADRSQHSEETSINSYFSLPDDWDHEACFQFNIEQYRKYIRVIHTIAGSMGIRSAFFIQPVPAIGKQLTEEEIKRVGDLSYGPTYLRMTRELLDLSREGISMYGLLDVFEGRNDTIYADPAHCVRAGLNGESEGYRLMSEAIAAKLETAWRLERRDGQ